MQRAGELLEQRQADHRRLIDDHRRVGQGPVLVVPELAAVQIEMSGRVSEQPMQRAGRGQRRAPRGQDLGDPVGGLAGRRRDGDLRRRQTERHPGLDDSADERGLAAARTAGHDGQPAPQRRLQRGGLAGRPGPSGRRRRRAGLDPAHVFEGGRGQAGGQRGGEPHLDPEIALLIEVISVDDERPIVARAADQRGQRRFVGQLRAERQGGRAILGRRGQAPQAGLQIGRRPQPEARRPFAAGLDRGQHQQREGPAAARRQVDRPAARLDRQVGGGLVDVVGGQIARPLGRPAAIARAHRLSAPASSPAPSLSAICSRQALTSA